MSLESISNIEFWNLTLSTSHHFFLILSVRIEWLAKLISTSGYITLFIYITIFKIFPKFSFWSSSLNSSEISGWCGGRRSLEIYSGLLCVVRSSLGRFSAASDHHIVQQCLFKSYFTMFISISTRLQMVFWYRRRQYSLFVTI